MTTEVLEREEEQLEVRMIRVSDAVQMRWEANAKIHNLPGLIESIALHGFKDIPHYDATLGGIDDGNGRTYALWTMEQNNYERPRGIHRDEDGSWLMPVSFGIDATSRVDAIQYALDANNLTFNGLSADVVAKVYDRDSYMEIIGELLDANEESGGDKVTATLTADEAREMYRSWSSRGGRDLAFEFEVDDDAVEFGGDAGADPIMLQVRQQLLFFNGYTFPQFIEMIGFLQGVYDVDNITDAVYEAVTREYNNYT